MDKRANGTAICILIWCLVEYLETLKSTYPHALFVSIRLINQSFCASEPSVMNPELFIPDPNQAFLKKLRILLPFNFNIFFT